LTFHDGVAPAGATSLSIDAWSLNMRKTIVTLVAAACMAGGAAPAGALTLSAARPSVGQATVQTVQFFDRGDRREFRRERRREERRYYNRNGRRYYRDSNGAEIFAGVIGGLAAGALIAGAAANAAQQRAVADADAVEYCESRFRSYDRRTGTYVGYDGVRRYCP